MFEPTLVGSFSRMVNFLRISWSILSPSVVNFYAHLVNSRCRLQADPLDFSGNSLSSHLDVFTSVYTNQAVLLINELDLLNFERSAQTFWQQIPETLAIEQESLLALLG